MANEDQARQPEQPDTTPPNEERQAELRAARELNVTDGKAPYWRVKIHTIGELTWVMEQEHWSGENSLQKEYKRASLSGVLLEWVNLSGADLREADLSGALLTGVNLSGADLQQANLTNAHLAMANLSSARIAVANLSGANLYSADLSGTDLREANLSSAYLEEANLDGAHLYRANLSSAHLGSANLNRAEYNYANLSSADLRTVNLSGANLRTVNLSGANLDAANLSGADFREVNLSNASLINANLSGANLYQANLNGADLTRALLNAETVLDGITLDTHTKVFGVRWNGAPLDSIHWEQAPQLGDESALQNKSDMTSKDRVAEYRSAARAYHGLSVALRDQGLADVASQYRLRELAMERKALRYERNIGGWLLNAILGGVAGHGEKPGRIFISYLIVVLSFAAAYFGVTHFVDTGLSHLSWDEALVLSLTSFHGRGFFPGFLSLGDWVSRIAALEAVIGLFIELILIATFSRRFLGD